MIRRPPRSTLFLHDALPISAVWSSDSCWSASSKDLEKDSLIARLDRKSTRLNSSHTVISYAVFCLKKKKDTAQAAFDHALDVLGVHRHRHHRVPGHFVDQDR